MGNCCQKKKIMKIDNIAKDYIAKKINIEENSQKGIFVKEQIFVDDNKKDDFLTLKINNKDDKNSQKNDLNISSSSEDRCLTGHEIPLIRKIKKRGN